MTTKSKLLTAGMLASALVLGGCDSAIDSASDMLSETFTDAIVDDPGREVATLIKNDDPSACAHSAATSTALGIVDSDYEAYLQAGAPPINVDTISTKQIDKSIHEITCSGMVRVTIPDFSGEYSEYSAEIIYKLRPSLDGDGGFVVEAMRTPQVRHAVNAQVSGWFRDQQAQSEPSPEEPAADGSVETEQSAPDNASSSQSPAQLDQSYEDQDFANRPSNPAATAAAPADAAAAPSAASPDANSTRDNKTDQY